MRPGKGRRSFALVGNPNTGKSAIFNALTGLYVDVSNYPGTTVEVSSGPLGCDLLVDTPGVYGVSSFSEEERVTRDVVLSADAVLNVVDAVRLERDLFLTLQLVDMGLPVVVALNMMDEVERRGMRLDVGLLSRALGVEVVPTVAVARRGLERLRTALNRARKGNAAPDLLERAAQVSPPGCRVSHSLLVLEDDPDICRALSVAPPGLREWSYLRRRRRADEIASSVTSHANPQSGQGLALLMMEPLTGIPFLCGVLGAVYYLIGVVVAQHVVAVTEEVVMRRWYEPLARAAVAALIPPASWLYEIMAGEFGVVTMTVTYLFGLLFPLVVGFYLAFSFLEDSGYLPRAAALLDRALTWVGLNGRAVIPLLLGFGCVTMATITTRILGSERERTIATFLLAFTIPCSAQLGVIAGLLFPLGGRFVFLYLLTVTSVFLLAGTTADAVMSGRPTDLLLDLPALRMPHLDNVLKKTWNKSFVFVREALPLFLLGSLIIGVLRVTGALEVLQNLLAPVTVWWLGLPREAATAFVMGMIRRDFGAAGLYHLRLGAPQTLVASVTITLFVPCVASLLVIMKERGKLEGACVWAATLVGAFVLGGILARALGT